VRSKSALLFEPNRWRSHRAERNGKDKASNNAANAEPNQWRNNERSSVANFGLEIVFSTDARGILAIKRLSQRKRTYVRTEELGLKSAERQLDCGATVWEIHAANGGDALNI
jgi:hypothetical protein